MSRKAELHEMKRAVVPGLDRESIAALSRGQQHPIGDALVGRLRKMAIAATELRKRSYEKSDAEMYLVPVASVDKEGMHAHFVLWINKGKVAKMFTPGSDVFLGAPTFDVRTGNFRIFAGDGINLSSNTVNLMLVDCREADIRTGLRDATVAMAPFMADTRALTGYMYSVNSSVSGIRVRARAEGGVALGRTQYMDDDVVIRAFDERTLAVSFQSREAKYVQIGEIRKSDVLKNAVRFVDGRST